MDGIAVYSGLDIAVFGNRTIFIVDSIALDRDGFAQSFRYFAGLFISQAKALIDGAVYAVDGVSQLTFRSSPVFDYIVFIPGLVVQASDVVAGLRGFRCTSIRFLAGNGLFADYDFLSHVSTLADSNFFKVRRIGHDDFQTVIIALADAEVLAGRCTIRLIECLLVIDAADDVQCRAKVAMDFLSVVAFEIQALLGYFGIETVGDVLDVADIGSIVVGIVDVGLMSLSIIRDF